MEKDGITVIEIWDSSDEEEVEERHRRSSMAAKVGSVTIKDEFKKKKKKNTREFDDDCFILDYDPFDSLKKLSINDKEENEDTDDLSVIAERGQVACRDFPHSRHLCVKFPFSKTPHLSHCEQCYCYVCDTIAPCKFWSDGVQEHCHATADEFKWKALRQAGKPISSTQGNLLGVYRSASNVDYDSQRDHPSRKDTESQGEGIDTFKCILCGHWPQDCPSANGYGNDSGYEKEGGYKGVGNIWE